jgi:phospholipid/cholesterol/gamma-HCH transport system substrate-binding protein
VADVLTRLNGRAQAVAVADVLLTSVFYLVKAGGTDTKTVTAHFPRAVSVYKGTEVRILGVPVGTVTDVIPEGNSVRVEMAYDAKYKVPPNAKAVIVTPTLVADRFVQLTPAWDGGGVMADGADIPLPDTAVPVELDRIYASLRDLSVALGPNGVNKDGTLDHVLKAGAKALEGNGELGNQMLTQLAAATDTFGRGSENLFATVDQLASFTQVLGANDKLVRAFLKDLAGMSQALVTERDELVRALRSVDRAVGTVESFVKNNRQALVDDVEKLSRVVQTINSEKDSLDTALTAAPLALGNLAVAFNTKTGSIGSRVGVQGTFGRPDLLLCSIVQQSDIPAASKDLACQIFEQLLSPAAQAKLARRKTGGPIPIKLDPNYQPDLGLLGQSADAVQKNYADDGSSSSLTGLMGGGHG